MKDERIVAEYKKRRQKRLDERGIESNLEETQTGELLERFRKRRNKRLLKRGINVDGTDVRGDVDFVENDHPRAKNGQFTSKGNEGSGSSKNEKKSEKKTKKEERATQAKTTGTKEYKSYYDSASKKISNVFPKNNNFAYGVDYKGKKVNLKVQTKDAQEVYNNIQAGKEYTIDELRDNETVKYMDELSDKITKAIGGFTYKDNSPERIALRENVKKDFMNLGAARKTEDGEYVFDAPVKKEFKAIIYTGLPAAGKSTKVNPLSEENGMFVFDNDVIKGMLPEFAATNGAAANAVHKESKNIQDGLFDEFLEGGSRTGDNIAIPIIGDDAKSIKQKYIDKLEKAGYDVEVRYRTADPQTSANRVVARAIHTGRIIQSSVVLEYGDGPKKAFEELKTMESNKTGKQIKTIEN